MNFHVGQKVVCVRGITPLDTGRPNFARETFPEEGAVYTVRWVGLARHHGEARTSLRLVEIINPVLTYVTLDGRRPREMSFVSDRFRPLRATNIDVFLKMLEPQPQEAERCPT